MANISSFLHALTGFGSSGRTAFRVDQDDDLVEVKEAMLVMLKDCSGLCADHLRTKIRFADSVTSLWLQRVEVFHCIASVRGEATAAQRLRQLQMDHKGLCHPDPSR